MKYIKIYLYLIRAFIKTKTQQRLDFILGVLGAILLYIPNIIFLILITHNNWQIAGLSFKELLLIQGIFILVCSPTNIICDNLWNLKTALIEGTYIKFYFKPGNSLFFYLSETINVRSLPEIVIGGYLILTNIGGFRATGINFLLFICSILIAVLIPVSLRIISASLGFWLTNSFGVITLMNTFVGYGKYPIIIFGKILSGIFLSVIPIGLIAYIPYLVLTTDQYNLLYLVLQTCLGILFFTLANLIWKKGSISYASTGS